jgi:ABC-type antimicrobial peptide transport system permease subunit
MAHNPATHGWGQVSTRFQCYVLFPPGLSLSHFNQGLPAFMKKHLHNNIDYYSLQPLSDIHFNARYGNFGSRTASTETLWTLTLIGVFLLVLGCINFINLATAQAVRRSREVGIRKVLGSARWQLAGQFLGETALLVILSSILAIGLVSSLSPFISGLFDGSLTLKPLESPVALAFMAGIAILVTFTAGFYPAIIISGYRPIAALKNKIAQAGSGQQGGLSLRRVLVTVQFTIAQALIIGVLVALSQMDFFRNSPLGFNKEAIITVNLPLDSLSRTKWEPFRQELLRRSGITSASLSFSPPASHSVDYTDFRYGQDIKDANFEVDLKSADASYPATYDLHLAAGRFYQPSDTLHEAVVNETLLHKLGINDPHAALGKYLYLDHAKATVVGVVKDFHEHSLRAEIGPVAILTDKSNYKMVGIKLSTAGMSTSIHSVEQVFAQFFPDYIFEYKFLDDTIAHFYDQEEKLARSFRFFAAVALIISCLGLYGLILFTTTQRIKEVGIRKVLGASATGISMLFIREFLWLIGIAFVIASPLAWYFMNKWLQNFTYRISISAWMFVATGLTALLVGLLTISIQTVRTARANPVKSLRSE